MPYHPSIPLACVAQSTRPDQGQANGQGHLEGQSSRMLVARPLFIVAKRATVPADRRHFGLQAYAE